MKAFDHAAPFCPQRHANWWAADRATLAGGHHSKWLAIRTRGNLRGCGRGDQQRHAVAIGFCLSGSRQLETFLAPLTDPASA